MTPQEYYSKSLEKDILQISKNRPNYIILENTFSDIEDIQSYLEEIEKTIDSEQRVLITYYNHFWEPLLKMASYFGFRKKYSEQNWLDKEDIENLLNLTGLEVVTSKRTMLLPIYIPLISNLINKYIATLPIINNLCLNTLIVARKVEQKNTNYSVSIIIPARNEAGNVGKIAKSIPKFGRSQEIIFVEGNSKDNTWEEIQKIPNVVKLKQKGKGKADAVRLGFSKAKGEILMIYDADRTVDAYDLKKFYNALASGKGEFANGSRLVYPMEKDAMRTLNKLGNKLFSILFTWILGQRFKDTLCGTKVLFKRDYLDFEKFRNDPFGDFELIFGAIGNNLKVVEIPVRYKERNYGSTNISRFKHGLMLAKMTFMAYKKFKAF